MPYIYIYIYVEDDLSARFFYHDLRKIRYVKRKKKEEEKEERYICNCIHDQYVMYHQIEKHRRTFRIAKVNLVRTIK